MADFENIKNIRRVDKSGMLDILLDLPFQCRRAVEIASNFKASFNEKGFDKILFTGLGGSGIGADFITDYLIDKSKLPVIVNKDYTIPGSVNKKTLAFVCSYSGNTEETLSAYEKIKKAGASAVIVTSGGQLRYKSLKGKNPRIFIPTGLPPRMAIGYMTIIPLLVLSKLGLASIRKGALKETIKVLDHLKKDILGPSIPEKKNLAKKAASQIRRRYTMIYAPGRHMGAVAKRWTQELNENAKALCHCQVFPEMNHNEITGWEDAGRLAGSLAVIFLRDKDEHARVHKRISISRQLIERKTRNIIQIRSYGKSRLSRMFSLVYIGSFVSFYLAMLNNVDPTPVNNVTYLKRRLGKA